MLPKQEALNDDFLAHAIIKITKLSDTTVRYDSLEPLMLMSLHNYLESRHIDYADLLFKWMKQINIDLKLPKTSLEKILGEEEKSHQRVAEVLLLADCLVMVAKELDGKPLTDHELFAAAKTKATWLADYTIAANQFQVSRKNGSMLWQMVLLSQPTSCLLLPSQLGPDIIGFLPCLPGSPSFKQYGPHCIPLTACSKRLETDKQDVYTSNYRYTNLWDGFLSEDGKLNGKQEDRDILCKLLKLAFGERRRCVRISFLYNPSKTIEDPVDDNLHLHFHYLHDGFRNTLKRNSEAATQLLNDFCKRERVKARLT